MRPRFEGQAEATLKQNQMRNLKNDEMLKQTRIEISKKEKCEDEIQQGRSRGSKV